MTLARQRTRGDRVCHRGLPSSASAKGYEMAAKRGISPLVENHHLGDECVNVANVGQAAVSRNRPKVLLEVTIVVGLMIAARKELEHGIVVRFVADLQRVHEDQPTAALQHAGELSKNNA